ncbi:MAG: A24 family peptidase [Deltaproteobacteria bacterium]|jgi:prepilin peptidase CpaA|nr:A24 family peptidase [Deltaproteobacteria bacterium]
MLLAGTFAFIALAVYAALSDLETRRVSNRLNGIIFASGLLFQLPVAGSPGLATGLAGTAVGLLILIVPFSRSWVGGGDVKFLAAAGAWLGPLSVFLAALGGLALGGVWAVALMARRPALRREAVGNLKLAAVSLSAPTVRRRDNAEVIPLVVPLAIAGVLAFLGASL